MAYTLNGMRTYVREHLDLDQDELTDSLMDVWAREASVRIWRSIKRWDWFSADWEFTTVIGQRDYPYSVLSSAVDEVISVIGDNRRLTWIGRDAAELRMSEDSWSTGEPAFYSTWAQKLRFFPTPSGAELLHVRGYRRMLDWVADGTGAVPDLPDELHNSVRLWMLGSAYMQQEDGEMGTMFLDLSDNESKQFVRAANDAPGHSPLIIGGGPKSRVHPGLRFPFE